jgi:DNA-binding response OmpR family regulator
VKVLLAEDDIDLSDVTAFALRRQGFTVVRAYSGTQALEQFESESPDVVVLDICLPGPSGIDVLRSIRDRSETPVIILTGRSDEPAMVEAFSAGADDYVTKPFSFRQLSLRLHAVTRRAAVSQRTTGALQIGRLSIDRDAWSVSCDEQPLKLTRLEFRILYCLASHFGRVTPTDRLLRFVWRDDGGDGNVLKTHISHIRQKLAQGGTGLAITAVPNVGYALDDRDPASLAPMARTHVS